MMKKSLIALLCGVMIFTGCSGSTNEQAETLPNGVEQIQENLYNVEKLPLKLEYGDSYFTVEEFNILHFEYEYKYAVQATVIFDVSNLTDKERYFLYDQTSSQTSFDNDMRISVILSRLSDDEEGEWETVHLNLNNSSYYDGKYEMVFTMTKADLSRSSYAGKEASLNIDLRQNENEDYKAYMYDQIIPEVEANRSETDTTA